MPNQTPSYRRLGANPGRRGLPRRIGRIPGVDTLADPANSKGTTDCDGGRPPSSTGPAHRRRVLGDRGGRHDRVRRPDPPQNVFGRDRPDGVTAERRRVLHPGPDVARHLDKLAAGGYFEVSVAHGGQGGAGRPSKRLPDLGPGQPGLESPQRRPLISLLGQDPRSRSYRAGRSHGEQNIGRQDTRRKSPPACSTRIGQRSFRTALHAIADALTARGFAAHAEARVDRSSDQGQLPLL